GMVLMYAVLGENGMYAPERRALSISRSRRKCARSGPSRSSTASSASSHSCVSMESGSLAAGNWGTAAMEPRAGGAAGRRIMQHMPARILDGKALAASMRAALKQRVDALVRRGVTPGLAVILAGDDPASKVYVRNKTRACEEVGVRSQQIDYPASVTQAELM